MSFLVLYVSKVNIFILWGDENKTVEHEWSDKWADEWMTVVNFEIQAKHAYVHTL